MAKQHYLCQYRLHKKISCFVWFNDEEDGVLLLADCKVACSQSLDSLGPFLRAHGITLEDEAPAFYDFDVLRGPADDLALLNKTLDAGLKLFIASTTFPS